MTRKEFIDEYGEAPEDVLGGDWQAMLEDFDSKD